MPRLLLTLFVVLICSPTPVWADQVDDFVREQMQRNQITGLSLAVVREGKVVKSKGYGLANVELNAPVTEDTVFEIASMSKQFTAGAVMLLAQDGRLRLDDSITKYLSGFPESYNGVTIRHLLNHTSGVKDYIEEFPLERRLDYTGQEIIKRVARAGLNFAPGEDARYSTTGYLLLGMIIERTTGKPYGEFLRERIFAPLGMSRTRVISLSEVIPNRATGYVLENGSLRHGKYVAQTLRASADIGLLTTALDLAKWDAALNVDKVFTKSSLELMFTPAKLNNGTPAYNGWNGYFGFGWFIDDYRGHREIDHGGTLVTGFHSNISRFPDDGLTVIVLTNRLRSSPWLIGYQIAGMYSGALRPPHLLEEKPDANPVRSQGLREFLVDVANGVKDSPHMSPGLRARLTADNRSEVGAILKELKTFSYIACSDIERRGVTRIGAAVSRLCEYKAADGQKTHYITFYLTPEDRVADMWIYSY